MPKKDKRIVPVIEELGQEVPLTEVKEEPKEVEVETEAKKALTELEVTHKDHKKTTIEKDPVNLKLLFFITIFTALVVGFVAGGVYVYVTGLSAFPVDKVSTTPTPTPIIEATPDPTPIPSASPSATPTDVSIYKVSVLNGSGKIGEAGKVRDLLKKAGYNVVQTGNAASYDFKETQIQAKSTVSASIIQELKTLLSASYEVKVGSALPTNHKSDIVVTIGNN